MEISSSSVFQVDSTCVNKAYQNLDNYLIEESEPDQGQEKICVVYFSSNYIYYPNTDTSFNNSIVEKNKFEWYHLRHPKATKHIFIRDIKKQWYLHGINANINSVSEIQKFLERETIGYKTFFVGSSSGGYIAVLLGSILNVERIYSFNGQFFLTDLLEKSKESIDPIIFREQFNQDISKFFHVKPYISSPSSIYYFHSNKSDWDLRQYEEVKDLKMNVISIDTNIHGVPLLKNNLKHVFLMSPKELKNTSKKTLNPIVFSIKVIGFTKTFLFLLSIVPNAFLRIYNPLKKRVLGIV